VATNLSGGKKLCRSGGKGMSRIPGSVEKSYMGGNKPTGKRSIARENEEITQKKPGVNLISQSLMLQVRKTERT